MTLLVPTEKSAAFSQELFKIISDNLIELADENLKWPHQMIFSGPLGNEVMLFIEQKGWDFSGFTLQKVGGVANSITFKYSTPLTASNDSLNIPLEGDSLHNKKVEGIPSETTIHKIIAHSMGSGFKIEKTVRPEKRIILKRKK